MSESFRASLQPARAPPVNWRHLHLSHELLVCFSRHLRLVRTAADLGVGVDSALLGFDFQGVIEPIIVFVHQSDLLSQLQVVEPAD